MTEHDITRRRVLRGVAAGVAATGVTGEALANRPDDAYVVGLKPGVGHEVAARRANSVAHELDFGDIGKAVAGRFPQQAIEALENNPNVRYVERDGEYRALEQTLPWGIDRVDAEVLHANGETGNGADIAILDTGIDSDHPDLQTNVQGGKCFVDDCCGEAGGIFCSTNDNTCHHTWDDDNDHGTHCSGIADAIDNTEGVVGVSTEANLHAGKVLDGCGSGSLSSVAAGIEWAADQGHDVASMSLGASSGDQTLQDAVQYAYNNGVLLVAAAGNDGPCSDCVSFPAAYEEVIAVSATDDTDSLADFSSTGPEVELAAPGVDILSTVPGGYARFDGTSMACPHVSGAGAQLMANGFTNTEARSQLQSTAEDIGLSSNEQGHGLVDAAAALGYDSSDDLGGNDAPTVDSLSLTEVETDNSDAEFDADWQVSDADGNLSTVDLTLTDDTDGETEDTASISVSGDTASGTTRLVAAGDDGSGNSYTVELVVTDADGATASDTASATESEDTGGNAPTIDSWSVSTRTTGPWFRVESDWAVSDADGDLDTVTTELLDSGGNVLDSASSSVSGSSASGSHEVRTRSNDADSVRLTVTDAAGNSTTDSSSV